jgi:probable rRNA maturation factor
MILFENESDMDIEITLLEKIAKKQSSKDIELIIVDSESMRVINLEQRGIDKSTDVLSFPLESFVNAPLGSIVINVDLAKSVADELGHTLDDEIALLFTHGMLHLLGHDHEVDDGQMRELESKIIKEFALPKSLIVRSEYI